MGTIIILLAMIGIPIAEIAFLVQAGGHFGLWPTLGAIIGTAITGTALLRHQGFDALRRLRQSVGRGEVPVRELFDGFCLLIAGALLLTPGFLTDGFGFALFLPPVRRVLGDVVMASVSRQATRNRAGGGPVIDGEFEARPVSESPPDRERRFPASRDD